MNNEQILSAINTTYILGGVLAIGFLLVLIYAKVSGKTNKISKSKK